ncbi:MAG: TadE/TadG family type IV pilus assembly protein [Alphaproteobacteria bacterium]
MSVTKRKFIRHTDGAAAVEFALLAPLFITMMMGIADFGVYINQRMQVENLARAAVEYVVKGGQEENVGADVMEATLPPDELEEVTYEAQTVCECSSAGETGVCGTSCDNGDYQRRFYSMSITRVYNPLFTYPGLPSQVTITGYARLQVD